LAQKSSSPAPPAGPHKLMRPKNHAPDRCPAQTCLQSPDPHQRRAISCPSCPAAGRRLALRLLPDQPAGHLAPDAAALPGQRPEKGGQRRPSARPAGCRDSASRAASSHRALGKAALPQGLRTSMVAGGSRAVCERRARYCVSKKVLICCFRFESC